MLADHGLITIRQFANKGIGGCNASRLFDSFLSRLGVPKSNVSGDGIAKQKAFLKHDSHLPTNISKVEISKICSIDQNAT